MLRLWPSSKKPDETPIKVIRTGPVPEEITSEAFISKVWDVDAVPFAQSLSDWPAARPVLVAVHTGNWMLHSTTYDNMPQQPAEIAAVLARAVIASVEHAGKAPERVLVRHLAVGLALKPLLTEHNIKVGVTHTMRELDASVGKVLSMVDWADARIGVSAPQTWGAWGHSPDAMKLLFAVAAQFYVEEAWRPLPSRYHLSVAPDTTPWFVTAAHAGMPDPQAFGIRMDRSPLLVSPPGPDDPLDRFENPLRGPRIALRFARARDLPRQMVDEIATMRWPIASPAAYPVLEVRGTPGGAFDPANFVSLFRVLGTMTGVATEPPDSTWKPPVECTWIYPSVGVSGTPAGPLVPGALDPLLPISRAIDSAAGPAGAHANAEAIVSSGQTPDALARALGLVDRYEAWLRARKRTVGGHRLRREQYLSVARHFARNMVERQHVELCAITELDLRYYLYQTVPLTAAVGREGFQGLGVFLGAREPLGVDVLAVPEALRDLCGYLDAHEGILYPRAGAMLDDWLTFRLRAATCPADGRTPDRVAWMAELGPDLEARGLSPSRQTERGIPWSEPHLQGGVERELWMELTHRWLVWRDALVADGVDDARLIRQRLLRQQHQWEGTPNAAAGGAMPAAAVTRSQQLVDMMTYGGWAPTADPRPHPES